MPQQVLILSTIAVLLYVLSPVVMAVGMGAIFAVLFHPMMKRIHRGRFPDSIAAALFTLSVTLLLFVPLSLMTIMGVRSALSELKMLKLTVIDPQAAIPNSVSDQILESSGLTSISAKLSQVLHVDGGAVIEQLKEFMTSVASLLMAQFSSFIGALPSALVAFSVFIFSFYYFLADGTRILESVRSYSIFNATQTKRLFQRFAVLCRSVILASLLSGLAQALLAALFGLVGGVGHFAMVFFTIFICSFVPLIGSFPVMAGLAIYQVSQGHMVQGLILAGGVVVVATVDNLIRPQVIKGGGGLHPLLGFTAAIGGLQTMGVTGVFLGPVLCGFCIEIFEILRAKQPE